MKNTELLFIIFFDYFGVLPGPLAPGTRLLAVVLAPVPGSVGYLPTILGPKRRLPSLSSSCFYISKKIQLNNTDLMDATTVEGLIKKGADVNFSNKNGFTALSYLYTEGYPKHRLEKLKLLVEAGAQLEVEVVPSLPQTPPRPLLFTLCDRGYAEDLEYLLAKGLNPLLKTKEGANAWCYVSDLSSTYPKGTFITSVDRKNRLQIFKLLNKYGVPYEDCLVSGWIPIEYMVSSSDKLEFNDYELLQVLLDYHLEALEKQTSYGLRDLGKIFFKLIDSKIKTVQYGDFQTLLRRCLSAGMPLDIKSTFGIPLVNYLSENTDDGNTLQFLIDQGSDFTTTDLKRSLKIQYPLLLATKRGHNNIVSVLLKAGADSEYKNESGESLFQIAMESKYPKIALLLLEHGASPFVDFISQGSKETKGGALLALVSMASKFLDPDALILADKLLDAGLSADEGGEPSSTTLYYAMVNENKYPQSFVKKLQNTVSSDRRKLILSLAVQRVNEETNKLFKKRIDASFVPVLLTTSLVGGSIISREFLFTGDLSANGMATVNGSLIGFFGGAVLGAFIGLPLDLLFREESYGPNFQLPHGMIFFGISGAIAGAFFPVIPSVKQTFQENRFVYYIPSAIAFTLLTLALKEIWFD